MTADDVDMEVLRRCREVLEENSKSFALAAKLLAPEARDRAAAVYAFCRRVDDAIDDAPPSAHEAALAALYRELDAVYADAPLEEPALRAFQAVVRACDLPRRYPHELVDGMAMDVRGTRYETLDDLLRYCHCVAGVVGLMMCHVFGITRDSALHNAAHLGIGMQLTNICRDVQEDWQLGRLYLPAALLREAGAASIPMPGESPFPEDPATLAAIQRVIAMLLDEADRYYRSADLGIPALPLRAGLAVRAARMIYHAIGIEVRARDCDPRRGRATVPTRRKLSLVAEALVRHARALPRIAATHGGRTDRARIPKRELQFPDDVLA